jgi:hypothetical protein
MTCALTVSSASIYTIQLLHVCTLGRKLIVSYEYKRDLPFYWCLPGEVAGNAP